MATRTPARSPRKRAAGRPGNSRRRLKPSSRARGLDITEIVLAADHEDISALVARIRQAGGTAIGTYRDPLGGRALVLATLPIRVIQPTPFQRDLSPTHTKRLAEKIDQAGVFLDPLIVVLGHDDLFWTPNGRHRLARREPGARETQYAEQFESAELLTLGIIYEKVPRFAGGAYGPLLKKVDRFSTHPLPAGLREREGYAARLQAIETEVKKIVAGLQARGFKSPYLRNYVVARINPVRFHVQKRGETRPAMPIGQALTRMTAAAKGFKLESVSNADLAWVAVGAGSHD
jgi:ParB family chromosome partitioning protein